MSPELRRRIYLGIGSAGLVLCLLFWINGWTSLGETRFVFPALAVYLAVALTALVMRPGSLRVVERSGFWVIAIVWLGSMAIGLAANLDYEQAWQSLSPGVFMNMALLVVLAYLWYDTHWALLASLIGPAVSTVIGLVRFWDSPEYVGRLLQYEGYVFVIAAFTYLLASGRDSLLTSQLEAERMRILAFEDALTGLPNRRSVAERLRTLLADDPSAYPLSVISFDLDEFKLINDEYGHDVGDRLLREVAKVSRGHVPSKAMLGRWGGEEFLVLLPGVDIDAAMLIAESLRGGLAAHEEGGMQVTASFGVIEVAPGCTVDDVLRSVDELLYRAKRSGRNTVEAAPTIVPMPALSPIPPVQRRSRPRDPTTTASSLGAAYDSPR